MAVDHGEAGAHVTVEEAGHEQAAEPAQLAVRLDGANRGLERRRPRSRGSIRTSSRAPSRSSPLIRRMNGFQAGYEAKSVTTAQTRSGGASISISRRSSRTSLGIAPEQRAQPQEDGVLAVHRTRECRAPQEDCYPLAVDPLRARIAC